MRRSLRSEEHTSELQSLRHLVCRLLLEKKNIFRRGVPQRVQHRNGRRRAPEPLCRAKDLSGSRKTTSLKPPPRFVGVILIFFFNDAAPPEIYTLSLPDPLPI